jgi:non-ribosomal peptide synthetase component F
MHSRARASPPALRYRDFVHWHNGQLSQNHGPKSPAARYWAEKLAGGIPVLRLPGDFVGGGDDAGGAGYRCVIGGELKDMLLHLAESRQSTLFAVMFSVYMMLLSRVSGLRDIGCSVIVSGREHDSFRDIVGLFVNSVLFGFHVDEEESFDNFLRRVNEDVLEAFQYQGYPMEAAFEQLHMRYPEVPVSFNMLNMQDATADRALDSLDAFHIDHVQDVKFDLEPYITQYENGIDIRWVYRKALFKSATIEFIVNRYIKLLEFFVRDPARNLTQLRSAEKKTEKRIGGRFKRFKEN